MDGDNHWASLAGCTTYGHVRTASTSSVSSSSETWAAEMNPPRSLPTNAFAAEFGFDNISTQTMPSFDAPSVGQQFEHINIPRLCYCDSITGLARTNSPGPDWLNVCDTDSTFSERTATGLRMTEEDRNQRYRAINEAVQHPVVKSLSNCGRNSVGFRIEGSSTKCPANISQVASYSNNGNATQDLSWSEIPGGPLARRSRSLESPCRKNTRTKIKKFDNNQCPICGQIFTRQDNIRPHILRKHPVPEYERSTSQATRLPLDHERTTLDLVQSDFRTSGDSTVPQKRSLDSVSLDDLAILNGSKRRRLSYGGGNSRRSLACPFQKHDPFQHQRCFALSLQRIKDVKQHIFRCHAKPDYYCASCYEVFDTATERDKHSRLRHCDRLDGPYLTQFEGITEDQRKQLSEKSLRTMDVEEQWFQIWSVVFPDAPRPTSVYLGNCLEEIVPLLRTKWEHQRSTIVARAGEFGSQHLSYAMNCAMDMFFRSLESLEGEVAGYGMSNKWTSLLPT